MRSFLAFLLVAMAASWAFPSLAATAMGAGGGGLPWEEPLTSIRDSLSGPVATAIGMMGFVIAGAVLVFGGDLSGFVRTVLMLVLALSVLLGANRLLGTFSGSGALIDKSKLPHAAMPAPAKAPVLAPTTRGRAEWN